MTKKSLILLLLGLIFSQIVRLNFTILGGFSFEDITFHIWPPAELALVSGAGVNLSSIFIGYLLYIVFGFSFIRRKQSSKVIMPAIMMLLMTTFAIYFEFSAIIEDYLGYYNGKHMRVGWVLFVYGLHVFNRYYRLLKTKE